MENNHYKLLLVDDEEDILEFLSYNLKQENFSVSTAKNGEEALQIAKDITPHLILLDVMMPIMDGIEACYELRKIPSLKNTIIVFLTARGEDYSQIAGFDAGSDDYVTKPIRPKVLVSRIKALLRRFETNNHINDNKKITIDNLVIDKESYTITKNNKNISLPKKEFELLLLLCSHPDKVFTREEIFQNIWGNNVIVGDRTIDVHVRKIREKIGTEHIKTIKGVGYKFYSF